MRLAGHKDGAAMLFSSWHAKRRAAGCSLYRRLLARGPLPFGQLATADARRSLEYGAGGGCDAVGCAFARAAALAAASPALKRHRTEHLYMACRTARAGLRLRHAMSPLMKPVLLPALPSSALPVLARATSFLGLPLSQQALIGHAIYIIGPVPSARCSAVVRAASD